MLPVIVLLNVLESEIVWFPVIITAPAARTLVPSVTSAPVSIPFNLVLSAAVIMAPEPASVTSDRAVTLLVVYTPLVTVSAFPVTLPSRFAFRIPTVPETMLPLIVALGIIMNFPSESSYPIKALFAPALLYFILIPLSRLSSVVSSPIV